jgi:hypothetical protein
MVIILAKAEYFIEQRHLDNNEEAVLDSSGERCVPQSVPAVAIEVFT